MSVRVRRLEYLTLGLLTLSALVLIPFQQKTLGWVLLCVMAFTAYWCDKEFRRNFWLLGVSIGLLGITPINTNITFAHMTQMGVLLFLAVALPYSVTHLVWHDETIKFPFRMGRRWLSREVGYIFFTLTVAYLLLPYYLANTGSYHNWTVKAGVLSIGLLFLGTLCLGTWDEFFFVGTVQAIFKRHFGLTVANLTQAIIFTGFLYELGFRGWAPFVLYPFALTQGYIFNRTHSLIFVLTIHLSLDLVLFLALIHAYYPQWIGVFVT